LRRDLFAVPVFVAMTIVAPGCEEANPGKFPEPTHAGASRDGVTPIKPHSDPKKAALVEKAKADALISDPRGR
jgi:hypothetical protein